jgi:hypothetical protein
MDRNEPLIFPTDSPLAGIYVGKEKHLLNKRALLMPSDSPAKVKAQFDALYLKEAFGVA